jgi:hypothetical protein
MYMVYLYSHMKRYLTLFAALMMLMPAYGQAKYEPQILILTPNEMTYDKALAQEISTYNEQLREAQKTGKLALLTDDTTGQPENVKIMVQSERDYYRAFGFSKFPSSIAEQFLAYVFIERLPNLMILTKDIKSSGDIADLKKIAAKQQMQYVLNFPKMKFYKEAGISKAKISVQFYDRVTNSLLINKDFTGDWHNPGGMFTCQDSSLICTIHNALEKALSDVVEIVMVNSPKLQDEERLAEEEFDLEGKLFKPRSEVLINQYYNKDFDRAFFNKIIPSSDTGINNNALYYGITDSTKTKFIAFYLESKAPQNIGYTVKGAKYKGKWYYVKSDLIYVQADEIAVGRKDLFNTLQQPEWGFFKKGSVEVNPEFWETNYFEKVEDVTKDPDWDKHKEMEGWHENEDRDYVGIPVFIAYKLKQQRKEENDRFDSLTGATVFLPFYEAQMKANPAYFANYMLWGKKPTLIFPKDRKFALNPIAVADSTGQKNLHFYFAFAGSNTVYEWTYLQPVPIKSYSPEIISQLEKVTNWNFAYSTLDDERFWQTYVLARSGNEYKYLKRIQ